MMYTAWFCSVFYGGVSHYLCGRLSSRCGACLTACTSPPAWSYVLPGKSLRVCFAGGGGRGVEGYGMEGELVEGMRGRCHSFGR